MVESYEYRNRYDMDCFTLEGKDFWSADYRDWPNGDVRYFVVPSGRSNTEVIHGYFEVEITKEEFEERKQIFEHQKRLSEFNQAISGSLKE